MRIERSGALVVGGASGLGEAAARVLHERGAHVVIADLDVERGAALTAQLGGRAQFASADVTRPEQLELAVALAAQAPGGLRISIHCAGIGHAERIARGRDHIDPRPSRGSSRSTSPGRFTRCAWRARRCSPTTPARAVSAA